MPVNDEAPQSTRYSGTLACGCTMSHGVRAGTENAQGRFDYWFQNRAKDHRCALVSDQNPNGTTRTQKALDAN